MKKISKEQVPILAGIGLGIVAVLGAVILLIMKGCVPEYNITFDTTGGTVIESLKIKKNNTLEKPEDPTREGYIFDGWYVNGEKFDFNSKITGDITLEARWIKIEDTHLTGISLDATELTLKPQGTAKLEVIFEPTDALDKTVVWTSSDETIATVDENGLVTALKAGTVTITVKANDGDFTATCLVTVKEDVVEVTGVSISGPSEVNVGSKIKLTANVTPADATNKTVSWKSSNTNIASVDKNGNVTGKSAGTVTITVTTSDGGKTASKTITVKKVETTPSEQNPPETNPQPSTPEPSTPNPPTEQEKVPVTGIKINTPSKTTLIVGETLTLTYEITPNNADNKNVSWSSSKPEVAKVENGKITALKEGSTVITVTTSDGGKTASVTITVKPKEIVYTVKLTALVLLDGSVNEYEVEVLKDNVTTTDYDYIALDGGQRIKPGKKMTSSMTKNGTIKTLTIVLKDGNKIHANTTYSRKEIE